ncbi:toxin-antitoxin system YwqK family antitoxin [Alloalcanivorax xenomutans]|uniref:toxin-antitoxin system YwqK family antitoxin n=1 Tax=Alloalcanivorax xenomutans TaxID=1094342 RepID=UPI001F3F3611|nr:hypothetical protein [Alloalcanivorax xenomutans]MCE7524586.1 hypothetical protein [Alloalcanivorax xenomutans]WOA32039.1 hypothetical protein RVY87_02935 [Alloalcanivorax xenomutans]
MMLRLAMLAGVPALLLSALAGADTRALDNDWFLTDGDPAFRLHWPLEQTDSGWRVVIDKPDGTLFFKSQIADPEALHLLNTSNRRGPFAYYHDNGQVELEGHYDDQGRITGQSIFYWDNGNAREIRDYLPEGYHVLKAFHENGGLAMEALPDKGERTGREKHYRKDGSLRSRLYTRPAEQGGLADVRLNYDPQGNIVARVEANDDVQVSETIKDSHLVERLTFDRAGTWSLRERFNEDGDLIQRNRNLLPDNQKDGEQIFVTGEGVRRVSHYRKGKRHGASSSRRGDTWLAQGFYRNDQPVGRWFKVDEDTGEVTVTRYGDQGRFLGRYHIGADLVVHGDDGKPMAPAALREVERSLPPVGTSWLYQFNDAQSVTLTLTAINGGRADYEVGEGGITLREDLNAYQPESAEAGPTLRFPLHPGDVWRYDTESTVEVPVSKGGRWQYRYRTRVISRVDALEKIQVGAGTFAALRISREIAWRKDQARGEGAGLDNIRNGGDGLVEGFTRELLWYAPEAGRVVLKAHMESGDPNLLHRPAAQLLDNAATWFTELRALTGPGGKSHPGEPRYAREPRAGWIGFAMHANDTWEYRMQNHAVE